MLARADGYASRGRHTGCAEMAELAELKVTPQSGSAGGRECLGWDSRMADRLRQNGAAADPPTVE